MDDREFISDQPVEEAQESHERLFAQYRAEKGRPGVRRLGRLVSHALHQRMRAELDAKKS